MDKASAEMPAIAQRMNVTWVRCPHPATLPPDQLQEACELRTQRRSGPGGQHRNKTSSGVFLTHRATGTVAEATERRSQAQNRVVALERLRYALAVQQRTLSVFDQASESEEKVVRERYHQNLNRMNDRNTDKPALLALLLNDLHAAGGQPSLVAQRWECSTTAIVRLIRSVPAAFVLVNQIRAHHGRMPLK
ncbi:peptide chain release factor family protein [Novipirellula artificiosorum]|uniref:Peptide chain release factor 1 n=1 Tax=Novipirellula artificiosorum TaxID=2528016 RepID=A0A5C6DY42_9BACT|nr:peptide chain release factor-like protein [Novipirellula artificiosorum]TWU40757.1 Peptide chain release factor 1 [Novipirellula artificiosorum]